MGIQKQLSLLFPFFGGQLGHSTVVATKKKNEKNSVVKKSYATRAPKIRTLQSESERKLLESIWLRLRWEYFPERGDLDTYQMEWSSRKQKRVLASCNIRHRRIRVARELLEPSAVRWLEAVVFHEMCHAVLGFDVARAGGKRQWHGKEFRALELLHPEIPALEQWIKSGGWHSAVRSNRARLAWQKRK